MLKTPLPQWSIKEVCVNELVPINCLPYFTGKKHQLISLFPSPTFQVLFAFMVGLHNLYWYYGLQTFKVYDPETNVTRTQAATELFEG